MTKPLNATQAVIEWVNNTRRYATRLDDEADALLAQLTLAAADESALNAACASHGCVGLYGYAQSAKAHLLTTLCGNENGKLEIITPDRDYDYFSHINPGHAPANMAIRFTRDIFSNENSWPLRLRLISEAELVQILLPGPARPTFVARSKNPLSHHAWRNGNRFANRSPSRRYR